MLCLDFSTHRRRDYFSANIHSLIPLTLGGVHCLTPLELGLVTSLALRSLHGPGRPIKNQNGNYYYNPKRLGIKSTHFLCVGHGRPFSILDSELLNVGSSPLVLLQAKVAPQISKHYSPPCVGEGAENVTTPG